MNKIIRLIDRTRTVNDWKCPRARYWGTEYLGRGIVKGTTSLELSEGIIVHDALAAIAHFTLNEIKYSIDELATAANKDLYSQLMEAAGDVITVEAEDFAKEQAALVEGLIRGFHKFMWPKLMTMYPNIICTEQEMEYPLGTVYSGCDELGEPTDETQFIFMTKPDLIVENTDGELVYIEYKTTSSKRENWINSWETAVQLHSSVKATEKALGRLPAAVQIVGLYKGYESYGKQTSPFCYAYKKAGNPPFTQEQIAYDYKAGFRRYPTWELDGGLKKWVAAMPDEILANQFPLTPQIYVNEELIAKFFKQRLEREKEIAKAAQGEYTDDVLDTVFPQRFDQCVPSFGYSCSYRKLCHGFVPDPLQEGFVLREPHHDMEREQLGLEIKDE